MDKLRNGNARYTIVEGLIFFLNSHLSDIINVDTDLFANSSYGLIISACRFIGQTLM